MADSVVCFLLENLSQLLAHEANLLCGVEDRVRSLHNELEIIKAFLKTSEGKNKNNKREVEQKVISQIRDVAHVAEDVIDTFITKIATHKRRSVMGKMFHGVDHAKLLHDVAEKIDRIKTTINDIHDNRVKYDFAESINEQSAAAITEKEERGRLLHNRRRKVEEKDVVGFVHDSEVVIKRLVEGGSRCKAVSIIGMGGLGKTTLARKVYNSNEVKGHFNCRAWVYVSNECRAKELLLGLLKHLMPNTEYQCRRAKKKGKKHKDVDMLVDFSSLSEDELKQKVRECLKRKRYLLVLDDLWKNQDWDEVQDAFPDDSRGSRILITSRLKEVALHTSQDQDPPYYLQFLTEEQSWELFSTKLFREDECPSNLEPLGKEIVKGCRGLPLSIVVLAGLLANKEKSHREWSKVVAHVNWYVTQDETQVKDIVLKLSYDNLPARLKPCFLYLGIFPEDFEIHVRQLVQRWVAEGFIQETRSRDPDDVAEDYLYELIDRSLIQVAGVKSSGDVKTCRIHDLLRDLCISESKEDKFLEVCMDNNILISTKPRRMSIQCGMSQYISSSNNGHSCVRSLFCFDTHYYVAQSEWKWLSKGFRLVRVLDLAGECCRNIPSSMGDFIHLRYLRIESKFIRRIPTSICTLRNLQTLDMGPSIMILLISFPGDIWKLKNLRHLLTYGPIMLRGHHSKTSGEVMWNLQTISFIELNRKAISLIEKGMFPKLRKLGMRISSNCEGNVPKLLLSLRQLDHLTKLEISIQTKELEGKKIGSCSPQEMLQNLEHLSHLSVLKIHQAKDLPMNATWFPPNIRKLTLTDKFDLDCTSGFAQLQVFRMENLAIQSWKLTNGAMPRLENIVIDRCYDLPGLTGGSGDSYVRHLLARAQSKGWRVVVFNSRGCGDSPVTTPQFYSASFLGDMHEVVSHVSARYPEANLYAVGWSLGANILVRYLGQESLNSPISGAVSLCNPFNLVVADEDFRKGFNIVYDKALSKALCKIFKKHALLFEDIGGDYNIPMAANAKSVREFDDGLTRVSFGFKSVDEYYSNSSSSDSIKHVQTPLLCIQAANDPIAPNRGIPREDIKENPNCLLIVTPNGGHLGWVAGDEAPVGAPWTDPLVMDFLQHLENREAVKAPNTSSNKGDKETLYHLQV